MEGGELHFEMVPQPAFDRASGPDAQPLPADPRRGGLDPHTTQSVSLSTSQSMWRWRRRPAERKSAIRSTARSLIRSALYRTPLWVDCSLTLCAKGFAAGPHPASISDAAGREGRFPLPSAAAAATVSGSLLAYYEGDLEGGRHHSWETCPMGRDGCSFDCRSAAGDLHFGLCVRGSDPDSRARLGVFHAELIDGSVLLIDGRKVVDNDSLHAAVTATGRVALEVGLAACLRTALFRGLRGVGAGWGWKAPREKAFR